MGMQQGWVSFWHSPSLCPAGTSGSHQPDRPPATLCLKAEPSAASVATGHGLAPQSHCRHRGHVKHRPSPCSDGHYQGAKPGEGESRALGAFGGTDTHSCGGQKAGESTGGRLRSRCTSQPELQRGPRGDGLEPLGLCKPPAAARLRAKTRLGRGGRAPRAHPCSAAPAPAACRSCGAGRCRSRHCPASGSCNASPRRPARRPRPCPAPTASSSLSGEG